MRNWRHRRRTARASRLHHDERGFVLVFLALAIPALLGLVGLAIEGARFMALDTQLAAMADASALAAANRLDRSPDAIANARLAAAALTNQPSLADRSLEPRRLRLRFASNLADLQRSPTFSLGDAEADIAAYVEATTGEETLTASFLSVVGARVPSIRRRAIAESQYYACDVTPALLCHPNPDAFIASARPGRQYLLRYDGTKNTGSIALLDRPDAIDGRQALQMFASDAPAHCYMDGVRLRTNLSVSEFDEAVGIRFDIYQGRTGPVPPDLALYPPAPSVVKGRHLDTCGSPPDAGSVNPPFGLPRDTAYQGLALKGVWDQGGGDWKSAPALGSLGAQFATALDEYLAWNHADKPPDFRGRLASAATRYDAYLAELGLNRATETKAVDTRSYGPAMATMPTGGPAGQPQKENAAPICYAGNRPATQARRRILYLALADCHAFPLERAATTLSRRVGKFFLTEPSERGAALLEFVTILRPTDDDGKFRHVVQLVATD